MFQYMKISYINACRQLQYRQLPFHTLSLQCLFPLSDGEFCQKAQIHHTDGQRLISARVRQ